MPPRRSDLPRPFLKWAGGKTQLLPQFEALYPPRPSVKRYLEPFLGSAAVFFHVRRLFGPENVALADSNEELVNVYVTIQNDVERLIRRLREHKKAHSREHFYRVRAQDPVSLASVPRAARTIYLNKTCFNGLFRVNSRGGFNVPMGRYANPLILDAPNLRAVSVSLRDVELSRAHFRETLRHARRGDFIYFDPPYQPISRTASFTAYTMGSFGASDQEELAEVFRTLSDRGCRVMLSNSDASLIHRLYRRFDIRKVDAKRSINSRGDRRGRIPEVVILNYDPGQAWPDSWPRDRHSRSPGGRASSRSIPSYLDGKRRNARFLGG